MNTRQKIATAKLLALAVSLVGLAVIGGWMFDIGVIKTISPGWASMKFDTAIAFVLSGVTIFYIARAREGEFNQAQVALAITTLTVLMLVGILFFSTVLGIHTGAEDLFIKDTDASVMTVVPGRPSLPGMANFILIALAGILTLLNPETPRPSLKFIGFIVIFIGVLPVAGYVLKVPILYYYLEGINSATALHVAILFILSGAGLVCLSD